VDPSKVGRGGLVKQRGCEKTKKEGERRTPVGVEKKIGGEEKKGDELPTRHR